MSKIEKIDQKNSRLVALDNRQYVRYMFLSGGIPRGVWPVDF